MKQVILVVLLALISECIRDVYAQCSIEELQNFTLCTAEVEDVDDDVSNSELCKNLFANLDCHDIVSDECLDDETSIIAISREIFATAISDNSCTRGCLSGDMLVQTAVGMKLTKDLVVGDIVSTGSGKYEPIVWNSQHYEGNDYVRSIFINFHLENGNLVTMTPIHFAHTTKGEVLASQVKSGDVMITGNGEPVKVVQAERLIKQGVYNPQTPSQQIEVNGVIVSTKTKDSPEFMSTIFKVLAFFHSVAPDVMYSSIIETVSHYIYEPIVFGDHYTMYVQVAAVVFIAARMIRMKA